MCWIYIRPPPKKAIVANKRQKAWEVNLSPKNGTDSHPTVVSNRNLILRMWRTWMHWSKRCAKKCRTAARARMGLPETRGKFVVAKLRWKLLSYLRKALHLFWELLTVRFLNFRFLVCEVKEYVLWKLREYRGKKKGTVRNIEENEEQWGNTRGSSSPLWTFTFVVSLQFTEFGFFLEVWIHGVFPLKYEVLMVSYSTVMKHWSLTSWSSQSLVFAMLASGNPEWTPPRSQRKHFKGRE